MKKIGYIVALALVALNIWQCKKPEETQNPVVVEPPKPTGLPPISPHVRGIWLTNVASSVLQSPQSIKAAVKKCRENGINHIFVVMWNKGKTLYPSKVMQDTFGIEMDEIYTGRDPLREIIDAAHADTIKVFAWFEYGFAAENGSAGEHILRLRPNWTALGQDGKKVVKNGFSWMNAFDPSVQNFMMSLLKEVVQKYPDLDGIQGDDRLPALPSEAGYNKEVVDLYKKESGGAVPTDPKADIDWVNWRADKLNLFAKRIYTEVKAIRPSIKIAMSPSVLPFAKTEYLQDWTVWVKNGWVDILSPQLYRYNIADYRGEVNKLVSQVPADKRSIVAPGVLLKLGTYKPSEAFLQQMIDEHRKNGINGEVFFFYEGLPEQTTFFQKYSRN